MTELILLLLVLIAVVYGLIALKDNKSLLAQILTSDHDGATHPMNKHRVGLDSERVVHAED
jgi:hypothetical protein